MLRTIIVTAFVVFGLPLVCYQSSQYYEDSVKAPCGTEGMLKYPLSKWETEVHSTPEDQYTPEMQEALRVGRMKRAQLIAETGLDLDGYPPSSNYFDRN